MKLFLLIVLTPDTMSDGLAVAGGHQQIYSQVYS